MLFFDQNNVVDRMKMSGEIRQLEEDRMYYMEEIDKDSARFHELTTDKDNLEKYAREQFLMKKKNEDVFVVIEEKEKGERWTAVGDSRDSEQRPVIGDRI